MIEVNHPVAMLPDLIEKGHCFSWQGFLEDITEAGTGFIVSHRLKVACNILTSDNFFSGTSQRPVLVYERYFQ